MKIIKKALNIFVDVVVIIILVISLLVVVMSISTSNSGIPNLFGIAPISVVSNSMEDTLKVNDLIFCEVIKNPSETEYQVGDIVTFNQVIEGEMRLNTHRIVDIVQDKGITYYITQGDNRNTNPVPDSEKKVAEQFLAKYTGKKVGGVGGFLGFIRTQLGFFLCILLPMIIFFVYEAIRVIMNIIALNKEKALEAAAEKVANSELTEEQKQRAIAEYLAQQKAQSEAPKQDSDGEVQTPASAAAQNPETPGTD